MKRTYLVLIICMLIIGFAAVATNLFINGTINFGFNNDDFNSNVVFTYTKAYNGEATIDEDTKKSITFTSEKIENVNQQAILRYDVANKSNQYDASVTISCDFEEGYDDFSEWLTVEQDLTSPFDLKAGQTQSGTLTVTLIKPYNEALETPVKIKCELKATPGSRNEKGEYVEVEHNYEEVLLQGADPVLEGVQVEAMAIDADTPKKLVPVKIDAGGNVTKANVKEEWYDYEHQEWANAVILKDGVTEPDAGQNILEENIESYFVWIPKFKYRLWHVDQENEYVEGNSGNHPQTIEVEFGLDDTTDIDDYSCETPLNEDGTQALSGERKNCENGMWMTHPAFITMGVPGFWVGKFETGYKDADSKTAAEQEGADVNRVVIKADQYSWRKITVSSILEVSYGYARNLDSHMMKNTEWGAVAYLSHSKYGINKEVAINNNFDYKTGYATLSNLNQNVFPGDYGKDSSKTTLYNTEDGVKASTTGNITGVYDMSGGAWEYMAAYRATADYANSYNSKYFDAYDGNSDTYAYSYRILGDATGEMGPFQRYNDEEGKDSNRLHNSWYSDTSAFINATSKAFVRGGHPIDGYLAGQFHFNCREGNVLNDVGFRIVLSPQ